MSVLKSRWSLTWHQYRSAITRWHSTLDWDWLSCSISGPLDFKYFRGACPQTLLPFGARNWPLLLPNSAYGHGMTLVLGYFALKSSSVVLSISSRVGQILIAPKQRYIKTYPWNKNCFNCGLRDTKWKCQMFLLKPLSETTHDQKNSSCGLGVYFVHACL